MLDPDQLKEYVIGPALRHMGVYSVAAEQMVLGTAAVESGLQYLHQLRQGPAIGLWQMEPPTHNDIYKNFLVYHPKLRIAVGRLVTDAVPYNPVINDRAEMMAWNLRYGAAMCRLHYYRYPEPLPEAGDIEGQAKLWKSRYNSFQGKGTVEKYMAAWAQITK